LKLSVDTLNPCASEFTLLSLYTDKSYQQ